MILLGVATLFAFAVVLVLCAIMHFADSKSYYSSFFLLGRLSRNKSFSLYPISTIEWGRLVHTSPFEVLSL